MRDRMRVMIAALALFPLAANAQITTKSLIIQSVASGTVACPPLRLCLQSLTPSGRPFWTDPAGFGWFADEARGLLRATSAPAGSAGGVYYNTVTAQALLYTGGLWTELVTTTGNQALANKTLAGNLLANGYRITGLPSPVASSEPATKSYVDALAGPGNSVFANVTGASAGLLGISTLWLRSPGQAGSGSVLTVLHRVTRNANARNLSCSLSIAPGGSDFVAVTVQVNGTSVPVACTITGSATSCDDTVNSVALSAGQNLSLQSVSSASIASDLTCSFEVTN